MTFGVIFTHSKQILVPALVPETNCLTMAASVNWNLLVKVNGWQVLKCASGQCFRICLHVGMQFLSIACAIYLSHFEEKVSFQVKITLKTGGGGVG